MERTFGVYKRRWRIFDRPHDFSIDTHVKLVYALVAIHNLINKYYPVGEDYERFQPAEGEEDEAVKRETDGDEVPE